MTNRPHDALFRTTFSQVEHARGTLRSILPTDLVLAIDWPTLSLADGSFVDDELAEQLTDLLYLVNLADGSAAFLYLLFEHQSTVVQLMALRLLGYMLGIWRRFRLDHPEAEKLPVILPIVLHHSHTGWTAPTRFEELVDIAPELREDFAPFIPSFEFVLEDLSERQSKELHEMATTALARLALFCLKEVREGAPFLEALPDWADTYHEVSSSLNGVEAMAAIMRYIHLVIELPRAELERRMLTALGPEAKEAFVTLGEQLIEQGRQEGRQEGRQQGQRAILLKLLRFRFGVIPESTRARLEVASESELERWSECVVDASGLADVFGD